MRSALRRALLALVAVVALGVVATASASASKQEFIMNGSPVSAGVEVPVVSEYGSATLSFSGAKATCSSVTAAGDLLAAGKSTSTVELSGCTVETPSNCALSQPVVIKAGGELVTYEGKVADKFSPKTGTTLFELHFSGSGCGSLAGYWPVTGVAQALVEGSEEVVNHALTFSSTSGSELVTGGITLSFHLSGAVKLGGAYAGGTWSTRPSPPEFKVGGSPIAASEEVPFESKNVSGTAMSLQSAGMKIECKMVKGSGDLLAEGASKSGVEYSSCTAPEPAHCKVAEPIVLKTTGRTLLFEGAPADKFSPETGETLTTIDLSSSGGTCSLAGELPVRGTLQSLVENGATDAVEHTLVFKATTGSAVEVAGSAATLKLKEAVKLSGAYAGEEWNVS